MTAPLRMFPVWGNIRAVEIFIAKLLKKIDGEGFYGVFDYIIAHYLSRHN